MEDGLLVVHERVLQVLVVTEELTRLALLRDRHVTQDHAVHRHRVLRELLQLLDAVVSATSNTTTVTMVSQTPHVQQNY